ncbi:hypothetical protein [Flavobacterium sp.]|uniref:hypothetical protein n=1 Tax=Flavobacterium sp. TaxID=239 RepID=UPI0039E72A51
MEHFNANNDFFDAGDDLNNIIRINNNNEAEDDSDDYDFDYDPNEMYYALNAKD